MIDRIIELSQNEINFVAGSGWKLECAKGILCGVIVMSISSIGKYITNTINENINSPIREFLKEYLGKTTFDTVHKYNNLPQFIHLISNLIR